MSCFVLYEKEIILKRDGALPEFADLEKIKSLNSVDEYFEEKQNAIKVLGLTSKDNLPEDYETIPLREYIATHTEEEGFKAFRAKGLWSWRKATKFCSACGAELKEHTVLTARECPKCKRVIFPRIEPCVIVLVTKGEEILLASHVYRNQDVYTCLAGFIEAGESAEQAVEREIFEETGIKVKNITYRGSQSWPFPDQLMLAFTAEYESGDIKLQKEEIADARWFDPKNCPTTPKPGSISYKLIHKQF